MEDTDKTKAQLIQELAALRRQNEALEKTALQQADRPASLQTYLLDKVEQAVIATDLGGHVIYWNPFAERLYGWSAEEARGKTTLELIATEDSLAHGQEIMAHLQQGQSWTGEYLARDRTGRQFPIYTTVNPIYNEEGTLTMLIATSHDTTERKQMEYTVRESEKRLKEAEKVANVGSWEMDIATGESIWSDQFFRICGFEPGAFVPTSTKGFEIIHPEDRERAAAEVQRAIEETGEYNIEKRIVRPDGSVRTVLSKGEVIYDERGEPSKLVGIFADITERKQAEQAVKESEAWFRMIAEHSADLLTVFRNREIEYVSPAIRRILGYSPEEFLRLDHLELIHPDDRERIARKIGERLEKRTDQPMTYVYRQKHKSGEYRWLRTHSWETAYDGLDIMSVLTTRDITDQIQAEQEIIGLNNRMEFAMRTNNMAWWEMELPTGTVKFNKNKAEMLGFKPEQFAHYKDFMALVHPQDYDRVMEAMQSHLAGEKKRYETEYRMKTAPGNYLWFRDVGRVIEIEKDYVNVVGIVRCIDERKRAEQSLQESEANLREANATKDKFFSIIAHDLKNPVIAVVSGTKLLKERTQNSADEYVRKMSYELHNSSERLFKLLENLLAWSRMEQGKVSYKPVNVDLYAPANYCISLLRENAAQKQLSLDCLVEEGTMVYADYNMLSTILRNLISNAIKFTPSGGRIRIEAAEKKDMVEVAVVDSGVGMSEDKIQRLFKVGEKNISSTGTAGEQGTGLGLILCQGFVEKHGGDIWIESQPGQGTTVRFTLPRGGSVPT